MSMNKIVRSLLFVVVVISTPSSVWAQLCDGELCPGRIWNPPNFQWDQRVLYVPTQDAYFVATTEWTFVSGGLVGRFVRPDATLAPISTLYASGGGGVTGSALAYNSVRDQILVLARDDSPQTIRAKFRTSDGQSSIGNEIVITNKGRIPHVAYSPDTDRYLVTYVKGVQGVLITFYVILDGDATNPQILDSGEVATDAFSESVVYNSVSQQFLVVYAREFPPPRRADIHGRFFSASGSPQQIVGIHTGNENQQRPQVAYASGTNTFLVADQDWAGGNASATVTLLNGTGGVIARSSPGATKGVDTPGPIGYNAATETFIATWRESFENNTYNHRALELNAADGSLEGVPVLLSNKNIGLMSIDTRPVNADPQAMILWRDVFGSDGVHAGIMHLPPVPPGQIQTLAASNPQLDSVVLDWLPVEGADHYEIAYATFVITAANFDTASKLSPAQTPDPGVPGGPVRDTATVDGLQHTTNYYFAVRVFAADGNFTTSNVVMETTLDNTPPASVKLFGFSDANSVTALWFAPGDDGTVGTATQYHLCYSTNASEVFTNFCSNAPAQSTLVQLPVSGPYGTPESYNIGLPSGVTGYYIALKSEDDVGKMSDISTPAGFFLDTSVTPMWLQLPGEDVMDTRDYLARMGITVEDNYRILAPGNVTLRAGQTIILSNGFFVENGADLRLYLHPSLVP